MPLRETQTPSHTHTHAHAHQKLTIVLDGLNAPVSAGMFLDLVERGFYDGMEIQRCVWHGACAALVLFGCAQAGCSFPFDYNYKISKITAYLTCIARVSK